MSKINYTLADTTVSVNAKVVTFELAELSPGQIRNAMSIFAECRFADTVERVEFVPYKEKPIQPKLLTPEEIEALRFGPMR